MALTQERQGEIAYKALVYLLKTRGFTMSVNVHREIKNIAKVINVTPEEAAEFAEKVAREVVDEIFASK